VFDVAAQRRGRVIEGVTLPMPGDHNVSNALAAIAVARHLGVPAAAIKAALAAFGGRQPALHPVGEWNGVTIIDDYGHHPVEIAAVLKAARQATKGRVIAVHQPHRFTRLRDLFTQFCACFNDADTVAIADVYAAGEAPIEGVSPRHAGRRADRPRPPRRAGALRRGGLAELRGRGAAGRHGGLPRRRLDLAWANALPGGSRRARRTAERREGGGVPPRPAPVAPR
jgi:hypothetical protein